MDDLDRLQLWLHQWILAQERKHAENLTEYWNRLHRRPENFQAAADYLRAVACWEDFLTIRDELWMILDIFGRR